MCAQRSQTPARAFEELADEFTKSKWREDNLNWKAQQIEDWQPDDEERWLAEIDPIRDRLFELASDVVQLQASTAAQFRFKAEVLLDLVHEERGDIVHTLATGLCRDILRACRVQDESESDVSPFMR